ncbi:MAG: Holliday junction resolvase RuvX [Actinomycetaceae bacterium]|nr:Holliday junction resolvase RuvX [Actinomycetaceae bacterium]
MRPGARVGVDVGGARVGVAYCDNNGILASPFATLKRNVNDLSGVAELVDTLQAIEVIVGLPLNMDGTEGKSAKEARRWARRLARWIDPIPVRLVDERLTTVSAHRVLHEAGRKEISHRDVVDQASAVIILDNALDYERNTGSPPGQPVTISPGGQG